MTSSCKSVEVFDFKEEDELTELASSKLASKFKGPTAIDKYKFLEHVAQDTNFQAKEMGNLPCVDVDEIENHQNCENALSDIPFGMEGEDPGTKQLCGLNDVLLFNSASHEQHTQFIPDKFEPGNFSAQLESEVSKAGAASPGNKQLNCAHLESPSSDEPIDVNLDVDECMSESSSSTSPDSPGDDVPLDGHGPLSDHCFGSWEMGDRDMTVVCPDYIIYCGRYCTGCVLIFSRSCVELKGSTAYVNQETFSCQWGIDDIIDIESLWFERHETAEVKIRLISGDAVQAENVQGTGIEELQFATNDSNWVEKQEEIMSLDVKYKALWNVAFNTDIGGDGEALPGQNGAGFPRRRYFPNFDEPFEEVIYPKGDSDAVSISKRDVDLLQPDTFVNDTIIDFYIKYLKNELQPDKRHRFHFFNSFFFRKLIDLDKDQSSAFESRAAFQRVRKWTRKVNLFEKDFVFIPVNFNYHWSLIVICHPGEIAKFQDEDLGTMRRVPCILHMDSIKGTHTGLKNPVQSYLLEEWKEKQKEGSEDISSKFFNLRFVPLELPQQQNSFDCGLFLLHYVERFLEEAPLNFTPFGITKFSSFLNVDWFPPAEPSLKRVHIQKLVCKIVERENSPAASCGEPCASNYPTSNNEIETGVEFISEGCGPLKSSHENVSSSQAGQGIEITLLPKSSQCGGDSDLVFREYIEAGAPAGSFLDGQYQTFERAASFSEFKPIEDVEAGEQFVYPPSNRTGFQQLAGIGPGAFVFPYQSKDFGAQTCWNQGIHQPEHEDTDASPETSICGSDDSLEVEVTDKNLVGEDLGAEEKIDRPRSPSAENIEFLTEDLSAPSEVLDVADSQSDHILDSNGNADHPISSPKILCRLSDQVCDKQENGEVKCDDVHFVGNNHLSESDRQQVLERTSDDSMPEPDGQQVLGRTGDNSVSEPDGQQIRGRTDDDSLSEPDGQQILERTGDDSLSEPDGQQILGRIGDDSVSEPAGQQILGRTGDDSVSEPDGQQILGRIGDDSVSEPAGQQILGRTGDDSGLEPDGQQILGRIGDDSVSEPDGQQILGRSGDDSVLEPDGQQILGRIGDDSVSEPDGQQILGRTGDDSVLEPDGKQVVVMTGDDSVPESDGQPAKEMIGDDLVPETDEQQTAKRVCDDSLPESDELQPAKRLRLTLPLEGEID